MSIMNLDASAYIHRLKTLGGQQSHIDRFYIALHDVELRDLEEQLSQKNEGLVFYQLVLNLYNRWKEEMGPNQWLEVWAYNESLGDADKNWLVSEAMDDDLVLLVQ